MKSAAKFLIF